MAHVCRGDTVMVIKGKERGKRGKVKRITKNGRVEIEKIMMVKRHTRPSQKNPHGGIQDVEGTIALSNVSLFCDSCSGPRRAKTVVKDGRKSRACSKCGSLFANPGM